MDFPEHWVVIVTCYTHQVSQYKDRHWYMYIDVNTGSIYLRQRYLLLMSVSIGPVTALSSFPVALYNSGSWKHTCTSHTRTHTHTHTRTHTHTHTHTYTQHLLNFWSALNRHKWYGGTGYKTTYYQGVYFQMDVYSEFTLQTVQCQHKLNMD